MRFSFKPSISRAMTLFGLLGLGVVQTGCAHPVVVEPQVVVHASVGYPRAYAPLVVMPRVLVAPPPVLYAPPIYRPAPWWGHQDHGYSESKHGHGYRRGHDRHGDRYRDEWRR